MNEIDVSEGLLPENEISEGETSDLEDNGTESEEVEPSETNESVDYISLLKSIDSRLETIESLDYSQQIQNVSDNTFRLYYFIGGLYVVFFIIIAIKFFKQFF